MKKIFKVASICCVVCLMAITMCACELLGDPAKVTKQQWENQFNYSGKVIIEQQTEGTTLSKLYVDGDKVKMEANLYDGVTKTGYASYDGQKYWQYEENSDKWTKTEITAETYAELKNIYGESLKFDNFKYNEDEGIFEATTLNVNGTLYNTVTVEFKNKKLNKITLLVNGVSTTVTFDYKTSFTITLPEVSGGQEPSTPPGPVTPPGGGTEGEQTGFITEQEWNDALNYDGKVYVEQSMSDGTGEQSTVLAKYYQDETKSKCEVISPFDGSSETQYISKDGSSYYQYYMLNEVWVKEEINAATYNESRLKALFSGVLSNYSYSNFVFNQANQTFVCSTEYGSVTVSFVNKKIVSVSLLYDYSDSNSSVSMGAKITADYGATVSFNLPQAQDYEKPEGMVSEDEWDAAIEYTGTVHAVKNIDGELAAEFYQKDGVVKYFDEYENVYTQTDGVNWWLYRQTSLGWEKAESDKLNCSNYGFEAFAELFGSEYWYNRYEFNAQQKAYIYEAADQQITIKFVQGKLSYIRIYETESSFWGERDIVITFDYSGTFTITLPQINVDEPSTPPEPVTPPSGDETEQLTQTEWDNAFNLESINKYCVTATNADGTQKIFKDGNIYKIDGIDLSGLGLSENEEIFCSKEGNEYYSYMLGMKTPMEEAEFKRLSLDSLAGELLFSKFSYDNNSKSYIAQNITVSGSNYDSVEIKFNNKKIETIICKVENQQETMSFDYSGNFESLTLPSVGGGEFESEQLSETEWINAFAYDGKMTLSLDMGYMQQETYQDGYKIKTISNIMGMQSEQYFDYDEDLDKYYNYYQENGNWIKTEIIESEYTRNRILDDPRDAFKYDLFTYDYVSKAYVAENIEVAVGVQYDSVCLYFQDGKLISIIFNAQGMEIVTNISYDNNFVITLPQVD